MTSAADYAQAQNLQQAIAAAVAQVLRERPDDVPTLCTYFLRKFAVTTGCEPRTLDEVAMAILTAHAWPGNIRELKNFVERITIMSEEAEVSAEDTAVLLGARADGRVPADALGELPGLDPAAKLTDARDWFERCYVERALQSASPADAARELGISVSNLHNKIRKYGIERQPDSGP